jgi:two-component system, chemotaxis family, protein-glutamate methylesterase/glutaminase
LPHRDVIALGASAGGHRALRRLVAALPAGFPAALLVTVHLPASRPSVLPEFLGNAGALPARFAEDRELVRPGRIYIAPPDLHMLAADGRLLLRHGPYENRMRPAIDPLFRSVAVAFGGRSIGVLLTGLLSDGVGGLLALQRCGGITVVQSPIDAEFPDLPRNALEDLAPDHVARLDEMSALLARLVKAPAGPSPEPPPELLLEVAMSAQAVLDPEAPGNLGARSLFTCPECHGPLWEIRDGTLARYRCHVGHGFAMEELVEAQAGELDRALSSALRALQERVELLRRLAAEARRRGHERAARQWDGRIQEYARQAELVRDVLLAQLSVVAPKSSKASAGQAG